MAETIAKLADSQFMFLLLRVYGTNHKQWNNNIYNARSVLAQPTLCGSYLIFYPPAVYLITIWYLTIR